MNIELKYGDRQHVLRIPQKAEVSILRPTEMWTPRSIGDALENALENPLGCENFDKLACHVAPKRVAIAVPDETRPMPVRTILATLLKRIYSALPNLKPSALTIVIGAGLHPPAGRKAQERIAPPEVTTGCRVVQHDALRASMVDFGVTKRGTPVRINADFAEADLKIVIGQIDPHQFVGFTGGAKGAVIGCGAVESIEHNHGLMFDEKAKVGCLDGNPVREDMNEAGDMVKIDMAINVVLDADNNVVRLLTGEPVTVLKEGAKTCAALYGVSLEHKYDIVIASCGGHPKDISLYQAQKGLNLASQALKQGGKILLFASCSQGVGDDTYFDYVSQFATPEEVLEDFKKLGFKMGAHKAFLFARTLTQYDVAMVSDLDTGIMNKCHLRAADPDVIIRQWVDGFGGRPRVAVVPNANTTYFYPK
ncbi:MAG: nickel-dependent lactate racemase [Deltaproteobacteria bacterium]|nr:nickel-dependent lactate racemase [Deltaproteobacteria bacterium]